MKQLKYELAGEPKQGEDKWIEKVKKMRNILGAHYSDSISDDDAIKQISQLFPQPLEKCPKCDGSGRVYICVGQMNEFYEKCPDCKGSGKTPQPLDDKELREKIEDILLPKLKAKYTKPKVQVDGATTFYDVSVISQILALLQQKIEEAILQARKEQMLIDWAQAGKDVEEAEKRGADSGVKAYESTCESLIVEARKQMVGEIKDGLEKCGWFVNMGNGRWGERKLAWRNFWKRYAEQALKGGENE